MIHRLCICVSRWKAAGTYNCAQNQIYSLHLQTLLLSRDRVKLLTVCTVIFSVAIVLSGAVVEYWQLVILRMLLAAG